MHANLITIYIQSEDPQWMLMNWPFQEVSEEMCQNLIINGSYNIQPLAAYTANDTLIEPANYQQGLAGALAVMSFRLKYALPWSQSKQEKIIHTTELVQLCVLSKVGLPFPTSPRKRPAPTKPLFGSPSKKHAL